MQDLLEIYLNNNNKVVVAVVENIVNLFYDACDAHETYFSILLVY